MHEQARQFTLWCQAQFPEYFKEKTVLDVGSGDINGNNRFLFTNCTYEGNDVAPGKNVTIVCKTSILPFPDESFDTIVSTECFEHDPEFPDSVKRIVDLLKPGGLFFFTCASTGRGEHGTRRTSPENSFGSKVEGWNDHYRNVETRDLDVSVGGLKNVFESFAVYYRSNPIQDLYFWGVKKGGSPVKRTVPDYVDDFVTRTA